MSTTAPLKAEASNSAWGCHGGCHGNILHRLVRVEGNTHSHCSSFAGLMHIHSHSEAITKGFYWSVCIYHVHNAITNAAIHLSMAC